MTKQHHKKVLNAAIILTLAGMVVLILWLTVFSRLGSESRHFYPPFWSYKAILNGSIKALIEDIGNIILFIPVGMAVCLFFGLGIHQAVVVGLLFSVLIECCQWFFWLGSFEIDDLLHNTIGAGIGAVIVQRMPLGQRIKEQIIDKKRSFIAFISVMVIIIAMGFGYQGLKWQEVKRLAALNNGGNGEVNLLVLSPDPVYIGKTDFNVSYKSDGSVLIEGSSDNRSWIEIGKVTLNAGRYSFSGLSGVPEKTVAIELEYNDSDQGKYLRLTPDVGSIAEAEFELNETTRIRALIGIYPGAEGEYAARPVIYREE